MRPGHPDFLGEWQGGRECGTGRLRLLCIQGRFVGEAQGGYACCAFKEWLE